ncbi:MAG TPA: hypothetical protein VGD50_04680 [Candidatus Baltobacteraceae bacterium]
MNLLRIVSLARTSLPRLWPLMRDERVPLWLKAGTVVSAVLIISPLDIFSDIPILGLFDDFTLLALVGTLFVRLASMLARKRDEASMRVVGPLPLRAGEPTP